MAERPSPPIDASSRDLELLDAANLVVYRDSTLRAGGQVAELDGLTLIIGTHPSPVIVNTILRTGPGADPGAALKRAIAVYDSIGHGVSLVTSSHADGPLAAVAAAAGWTSVFELVGMILYAPIALGETTAGVRVFLADPVTDLAAVCDVEVNGFAESEDERSMARSVFSDPDSIGGPGTAALLAEVESPDGRREVASAAIVDRGPAALISWVATRPEFRRRGLGGLVTTAAANRGFEMGCPAVVLQASPMGLPVYRRLGFRPLNRYQIWEPPKG